MNQHVKKITEIKKNNINVYTEILLHKFRGIDLGYNVLGRGAFYSFMLVVLHISVFWVQKLFCTEPYFGGSNQNLMLFLFCLCGLNP